MREPVGGSVQRLTKKLRSDEAVISENTIYSAVVTTR